MCLLCNSDDKNDNGDGGGSGDGDNDDDDEGEEEADAPGLNAAVLAEGLEAVDFYPDPRTVVACAVPGPLKTEPLTDRHRYRAVNWK